MHTKIGLLAALLVLTSGAARADTLSVVGYFNDAGNSALVGSDLGAALFADDWDIANNVALYDLSIPHGGIVGFRSFGYAAGGAEPYFSLFSGSRASMSTASFVLSNYFDPSIDFDISTPLSAGSYVVALGVWENMSFAENLGAPLTLGDGFVGLGVPEFLGSSYYELGVTRPDGPVPPIPEPATLLLIGSGAAGLSAVRKRLRRP
jgi:hypothetical protein